MGDHGELHYGFFGLTALGPTSTFKQGQMLSMGTSVFSDEEWLRAFNRYDADGSGQLDVSFGLLGELFEGSPPVSFNASV